MVNKTTGVPVCSYSDLIFMMSHILLLRQINFWAESARDPNDACPSSSTTLLSLGASLSDPNESVASILHFFDAPSLSLELSLPSLTPFLKSTMVKATSLHQMASSVLHILHILHQSAVWMGALKAMLERGSLTDSIIGLLDQMASFWMALWMA